MQIISRADALRLGLNRYFTGEPCKNGHVAERYMSSGGMCLECRRERDERNAESIKAYRERVRDSRKAYCREWYNKNRDSEREAARLRGNAAYAADPEKFKARVAARKVAEPEKVRASNEKSYNKNRAKRIAYSAEWVRNNPEKAAALRREQNAARYARMKHALPKWADREAIREFYLLAAKKTEETGVIHEVDHIWPIACKTACGLHVHNNLQVVPREINRRKLNRVPIELAESRYS